MGLFNRDKGRTETPQLSDGVIGKDAILKANDIAREYKAGKANLEKRIQECEKWWRLRHWEVQDAAGGPSGNPHDLRPKSAWLFNVIMGKHADAVEAYPKPTLLPQEAGDVEEAKRLTDIIPVILRNNAFKKTYRDAAWTKNISGTAVYGNFWDASKLNGLGDISIKEISVLNLFWKPGINDIQDSPHLFHIELVDAEAIEEAYPQLKGQVKSGGPFTLAEFDTEDRPQNSKKCLVVDWYYKKRVKGRTVLHYCKYVGSAVLYATENDPELAERGWYDDGLYPFVFDALFPTKGSPCGVGYVDISKSPQMVIDLLNQQLVKSAIINATPRAIVRKDTNINIEQYTDVTEPVVEAAGMINDDAIRFIQTPPPSPAAMDMRTQMIEEMKYTAGNLDVLNGGTTGGVTAASGLLAQIQTAGRTSRDAIDESYGAYEKLVTMTIERIRQFYTLPRQFRITGRQGEMDFITYSAENLQPQPLGEAFGQDQGMRLPVFDVEVVAEKHTPYSQLVMNELAVQLYGMGIFNPQMADQALMMLDMMDFQGKNELIRKIQENSAYYQQMMMWQQMMGAQVQQQQPVVQAGAAPMRRLAPELPGGRRMDDARAIADQAAQPL